MHAKRTLAATSLIAAFVLSGCGLLTGALGGGASGSGSGNSSNSSNVEDDLHKYRDAAKAKPGAYKPASEFAEFAAGLQKKDTPLDEAALVDEAVGYLDAVDEDAHIYQALADKGGLLYLSGDKVASAAAYKASMEIKPSMLLIPGMLLALDDDSSQVASVCESVRGEVSSEKDILELMKFCKKSGDSLTWVTSSDQAMFDARVAADRERAAAAAERRRKEEAAKPKRYEARISVRNGCGKTVKTFKGRVSNGNKGSGSNSSLGGSTTSSYSLSGDDQFCIVADNGDIMSCSQPPDGARLEVSKSCSGLSMR